MTHGGPILIELTWTDPSIKCISTGDPSRMFPETVRGSEETPSFQVGLVEHIHWWILMLYWLGPGIYDVGSNSRMKIIEQDWWYWLILYVTPSQTCFWQVKMVNLRQSPLPKSSMCEMMFLYYWNGGCFRKRGSSIPGLTSYKYRWYEYSITLFGQLTLAIKHTCSYGQLPICSMNCTWNMGMFHVPWLD